MQVDYASPGTLRPGVLGADGTASSPIMIHRALFGSIERFFGILIEH